MSEKNSDHNNRPPKIFKGNDSDKKQDLEVSRRPDLIQAKILHDICCDPSEEKCCSVTGGEVITLSWDGTGFKTNSKNNWLGGDSPKSNNDDTVNDPYRFETNFHRETDDDSPVLDNDDYFVEHQIDIGELVTAKKCFSGVYGSSETNPKSLKNDDWKEQKDRESPMNSNKIGNKKDTYAKIFPNLKGELPRSVTAIQHSTCHKKVATSLETKTDEPDEVDEQPPKMPTPERLNDLLQQALQQPLKLNAEGLDLKTQDPPLLTPQNTMKSPTLKIFARNGKKPYENFERLIAENHAQDATYLRDVHGRFAEFHGNAKSPDLEGQAAQHKRRPRRQRKPAQKKAQQQQTFSLPPADISELRRASISAEAHKFHPFLLPHHRTLAQQQGPMTPQQMDCFLWQSAARMNFGFPTFPQTIQTSDFTMIMPKPIWLSPAIEQFAPLSPLIDQQVTQTTGIHRPVPTRELNADMKAYLEEYSKQVKIEKQRATNNTIVDDDHVDIIN